MISLICGEVKNRLTLAGVGDDCEETIEELGNRISNKAGVHRTCRIKSTYLSSPS
jgi:hypothetical protein